MPSDATSETANVERPQNANLKPFAKGTTGCFGGGRGRFNRALADELARFISHHGRDPDTNETLQLEALTLARLDTKALGTDRATVIARIAGRLYGGPKPDAPRSPLRSLTSAELLRGHKAATP